MSLISVGAGGLFGATARDVVSHEALVAGGVVTLDPDELPQVVPPAARGRVRAAGKRRDAGAAHK